MRRHCCERLSAGLLACAYLSAFAIGDDGTPKRPVPTRAGWTPFPHPFQIIKLLRELLSHRQWSLGPSLRCYVDEAEGLDPGVGSRSVVHDCALEKARDGTFGMEVELVSYLEVVTLAGKVGVMGESVCDFVRLRAEG